MCGDSILNNYRRPLSSVAMSAGLSVGLLSGRSRVQSPAGPPTRVFKITVKIMRAVIKDLVSVQMIASLGGDVKPLALSPS